MVIIFCYFQKDLVYFFVVSKVKQIKLTEFIGERYNKLKSHQFTYYSQRRDSITIAAMNTTLTTSHDRRSFHGSSKLCRHIGISYRGQHSGMLSEYRYLLVQSMYLFGILKIIYLSQLSGIFTRSSKECYKRSANTASTKHSKHMNPDYYLAQTWNMLQASDVL